MTREKRGWSVVRARGLSGALLAMVAMLAVLVPAEAARAAVDGRATAPTANQSVALLPCWATPGPGIDAVNVRRTPSTLAARIGIMSQGQSADADCNIVNGGAYTTCLGGGVEWVRVIWAGATGYVALWCVTLFTD